MAELIQGVPGAKFVYSDLSMITMMFVVGKLVQQHGMLPSLSLLDPRCMGGEEEGGTIQNKPWLAQCYYEAFVRTAVIGGVPGMDSTGFLPPDSVRNHCQFSQWKVQYQKALAKEALPVLHQVRFQ